MKKLTLKIITQEKIVLEREIVQATLPIEDGEVTVLADHIPLIGSLHAGEIKLKDTGGKEELLAVSGGFVEFHDNTLTLLADTAERAEEIDIERAEAGKKRAEEVMQSKADLSEEEYARIAALLEKELSRLRVAKKHYTKGGLHIES
ncbi:MAG: ATP synthase F1 subunit epsilon [Candidatus Moraniibacteriota bacterium]